MRPQVSYGEVMRRQAWSIFYSDLNKGKVEAWDKVALSLEHMLKVADKSEKTQQEKAEVIREYCLKHATEITRQEIIYHCIRCLYDHAFALGIEDVLDDADEGNRYFWNSINDILRCVKRIKNDEDTFTLPNKDKELTLGFLKRLSSP